MSYGTVRTFKTKKALKEAIAVEGPDRVAVFGTSIFGNETATSVSDLKDADVVVGPDVYNKRSWYANGAELRKVKRLTDEEYSARLARKTGMV
jgi:hypothetical protein